MFNKCSHFQLTINLNIIEIENQDKIENKAVCNFILIGDEQLPINTTLPYEENLTRYYQDWKTAYLKAYESETLAVEETSFFFTPDDKETDWKDEADTRRIKLLNEFNKWLSQLKLLPIGERLNGELVNGNCLNLLIACNSPLLEKLPWEQWEIAQINEQSKINIYRTIINCNLKNNSDYKPLLKNDNLKPKKPRILAILADADELQINKDLKGINILKKIANVDIIQFKHGQNEDDFKQKLTKKLTEIPGWDLLIFIGHGEETDSTGGRLQLAHNIFVSLTAIENELIIAKKNGLRCAILNSCEGIKSAENLINLGFHQVLVMREKVHIDFAHPFFELLSQELINYHNIQQALIKIREYFIKNQVAYPSAYLIPSLYYHPDSQVKLFQIESVGWRKRWRNWRPKKAWEFATFSSLFLLSILYPVVTYPIMDFLIEMRMFSQSIFRDFTGQIPEEKTPIQLVVIDQESLNEAREKPEFSNFEVYPMDRRYLTKIFQDLSNYNPQIIALNYEIYTESNFDLEFKNTLISLIKNQKSWLIFSTNFYRNRKSLAKIVNPHWSLEGDVSYYEGEISFPLYNNLTCQNYCSFSYLMALSFLLKNNSTLTNLPQPNFHQNQVLFKNQVNEYLNNQQSQDLIINQLAKNKPFLGWRSPIDYSLPPQQVYNWISAKDLTSLKLDSTEKIFIITAGGYKEATDNLSQNFATYYWCFLTKRKQPNNNASCLASNFQIDPYFTAGENHAYMTYQMIFNHRIVAIPDFYLVILATIVGKWLTLILVNYSLDKRKKLILYYLLGVLIFNLINLEIFVITGFLIPNLFPSIIISLYLLSQFRGKNYA